MVDLHIQDDAIRAIDVDLPVKNGQEWDLDGAWVSPGWVDVGAWVPDPGYEQREDFASAARAAARGGFTDVLVLPNTEPVLDGKAAVQYVRSAEPAQPVAFHPIGAVTRGCQGTDITEMMDMEQAGAVAFSDGLQSIQHSGMLYRALLYVKAFHGLVINAPLDESLAGNGLMHEGVVSTSLGLRGIPDIAESLMVQRDINLLAYTNSRLHLADISKAASLPLIREAKARGLRLTCSVSVHHLQHTDEQVRGFDTNYKLTPPLGTDGDREALRKALLDGTIDLVTSQHRPWEEDHKKLEFPFAAEGVTGLETAFGQLMHSLGDRLDASWLAMNLAHKLREIFGLKPVSLEAGQPACLTCFSLQGKSRVEPGRQASKSANSPALGQELPGRILGVVHRGFWVRSSE
jgi:dihydroorotase